jgi:transcriptional regulator with XRE-family HTH domain
MKPSPTSRVADTVRGYLASRGKTQADLASHLGISQQSVSRRLTGGQPFNVVELQQVAEFLGVRVTDLIADAA